MSKILLDLLNKINKKKQEVKDLVAADKLEEAQEAKNELKKLQNKFNIMEDLDDEEEEEIEEKIKNGKGKKVTDTAKKVSVAFVNAIKAGIKREPVSTEDKEILDSMSEGSKADGGLIVPQDIRTEVKELRRSEDALETYVNVEPVTTESGSRVIEKDAENTPFDNVEEGAEFPEESTPQFENIEYKVKKKGGILKVTEELIQDAAENVLARLKKWIAKKSKATRNFLIIKKIKEITKGKEKVIAGLDTLKDILNEELDPAIALNAKVFTNQKGFNWLDKLKDSNGRYILQPDPTQPTKKLLFGVYEVVKLSNRTLKNIAYSGKDAIPVIIGDLKEAIMIFDRELMTIDISNLAGDLWNKDQTGIKVRERLDVQSVDAEAVIMGVIPLETSEMVEEPVKSELEIQLNEMTKDQILAYATEQGYELSVTSADKKDDIIKAVLAAAEAAENA